MVGHDDLHNAIAFNSSLLNGTRIFGPALAGLLIAVLAFGEAPSALFWGLLWCPFAGTALLALFCLLQCLATSRRGGNVLTSMVLFPLMRPEDAATGA